MTHVVSQPLSPFLAMEGRIEVHQIPAATDNLIWLIRCVESNEVAAVDGPEAARVLSYCEAHDLHWTTILNTHTHHDHVGINQDLEKRGLLAGFRVIGSKTAADGVPGITERVNDGDEIAFGSVTGSVLLTEGHIDGHVSYVFGDVLFCGDTMFGAGCGYLFDGPPAKMFASLLRLANLPGNTRVCCAHEYTQDNLRFAWSIEPNNEVLAERIRRVWELRARGESSVPSSIEEERATNPFLRPGSPVLQASVRRAFSEKELDEHVDFFAATRALKDRRDYKSMPESSLPLDQ